MRSKQPTRADVPPKSLADELPDLLLQLPSAVCVCAAPEGRIRFFNRRAAELWGREPRLGDPAERYCGALRTFALDGTPLEPADSPAAATLIDGEPHEAEFLVERPDGSRVTVHATAAPLHGPDGALTGAVSVLQEVTERREAEESLRQSEARYRALVEDQPDLLCRFLPDGRLTFANEAYCRYFGLHSENVVGNSYVHLIHPQDLAEINTALAELSPSRRMIVCENRVLRHDGAIRWTQWTNHAIFDAHGHVLEYQSSGRDITERRRDEDDAARLAAIVASAEDAIVSTTLSGLITSWNRGAERIFGYSADEATGQLISIIVPDERRAEQEEILSHLARGEALESYETECIARDGRLFPASITVSPVQDSSGRVIGISKIARDISERKRAEEILVASIRTLEVLYRLVDEVGRSRGLVETCQSAVEALVSGLGAPRASILVFDERGGARFVAWRNLSDGYRTAVDGHSPWTRDAVDPVPILLPDVLADPDVGPLRDVIAAEGIRALGFLPLVHQGRLLGKCMVYYDEPHDFSSDELRLATTIAQHVASGVARAQAEAEIARALVRERAARQEADEAQAEAEHANRAKDEFLAMLAHELRNPLGVIVNAVGVLDVAGSIDPVHDRAQLMIRRQAEHLARLLDDLLDVARITSGRIELERQCIDLRSAVQLAAEMQRHQIDRKGQGLDLDLPAEPISVLGDSVRIQQVLGNLLNNASKYTPSGGWIRVAIRTANGQAVLTVRDSGEGIPTEKLEEVFELFAQVDATLARTDGGLGIGLTLVRRIVELHGGTVHAESEGQNRGAAFVIRLPLIVPPAFVAPRPQARPAGRSLRILVVEDQPDAREMLATLLRLHGHETSEAATGDKAIALAVEVTPDVALIDIGLPDIEGYEVARELRRELGQSVCLVALTGYGQPEDRDRSQAAGFDEHLVKPVDPGQLAETLGRLAARGSSA
jgi:PAS domain S-box-containing protein